MKKVTVMCEDKYQVLEILCRYLHLKEEEIEAIFVVTGKRKLNENIQAEEATKKIKLEDFDRVSIPPDSSAPHFSFMKELLK